MNMPHQYIDRETAEIRTEKLYGDRLINLIYNHGRERMSALFRALTSARTSSLLGFINFDSLLSTKIGSVERFLASTGIDLGECVENPLHLDTPRKIFERKIRYWRLRPMPMDAGVIVSPADSKVLFGSFDRDSLLFIKDKFFRFDEMLGANSGWRNVFAGGSFAVFRLTPEKYHYNHNPVSGQVVDFYGVDGDYHSCNPGAIVRMVTPHSKNKRYVTLINTDVPGGSNVGLVAMIEVVALMIGEVEQCYSPFHYDSPRPVSKGLFINKGQPKSLFKPGSSTTVLFFQSGRIRFDGELIANMGRVGVSSRFSSGFNRSLAETDIKVRSAIGRALPVSDLPFAGSSQVNLFSNTTTTTEVLP